MRSRAPTPVCATRSILPARPCYSVCSMLKAIKVPVLPKIVRRRSKLHGWGVFALDPINKNKRIVTYEGELIDHKESLKREGTYLDRGEIWCFTVNTRWVKDAMVGGNIGRFINHACKPNCYSEIVGREIWIRAGRNIKP